MIKIRVHVCKHMSTLMFIFTYLYIQLHRLFLHMHKYMVVYTNVLLYTIQAYKYMCADRWLAGWVGGWMDG